MKGTEIMTTTGIKVIENIENGDKVINKNGKEITVLFSGSRMTYLRTSKTMPYIIEKDALSNNVPHKDTYVSPLHKIYTENHGLVEVRELSKLNKKVKVAYDVKKPYIYHTLVLNEYDSYFANNMPVESMPKENYKMYNFLSANKIEAINAENELLSDN